MKLEHRWFSLKSEWLRDAVRSESCRNNTSYEDSKSERKGEKSLSSKQRNMQHLDSAFWISNRFEVLIHHFSAYLPLIFDNFCLM